MTHSSSQRGPATAWLLALLLAVVADGCSLVPPPESSSPKYGRFRRAAFHDLANRSLVPGKMTGSAFTWSDPAECEEGCSLDRLAYEWFQYQAQLRVLRLTATAFQDHFNEVMEAVHGSDFMRVRPAGKVGDRKCDGYHKPTDTVFQVYAPKRIVLKEWTDKINEDFAGARAQWNSMRGWTFVHNDYDGLPADVTQALLRLRRDNPDLTIDQWSPQHLCSLTKDLTFEQLQPLFGNPPTDKDMRTLDRSDIAVAVAGLATEGQHWVPGPADLPTVDPRKIDYNKLSIHPRRLLTAGMTQAQMVDDYFAHHPDPTLRDRTAMLMKVEWMRLQAQGVDGDAAFHALCDKALPFSTGSRQMSAALALLAYLFESCDIFDNPPSGWTGAAA